MHQTGRLKGNDRKYQRGRHFNLANESFPRFLHSSFCAVCVHACACRWTAAFNSPNTNRNQYFLLYLSLSTDTKVANVFLYVYRRLDTVILLCGSFYCIYHFFLNISSFHSKHYVWLVLLRVYKQITLIGASIQGLI